MKKSILRRVLIYMIAFGMVMGVVFPIYAQFFVHWKKGMQGWFILGCLIAGLMVGVMSYFILRVVVLRKIFQIAEVNKKIADGDLCVTITMDSADRLGDVCKNINNIVDSFQQTVGIVKKMTVKIDDGSGELSTEIDNLSSRTNEAASSIEEVSASIEEITASLKETAHSSSDIASHMSKTAENVRFGISGIGKILEAIAGIRNTGKEIENIADVVEEISFQTNILALNASIEAARAGQYGKGFAVVADEVRKLAQKSSEAVISIKTLVKDNNDNITNANTVSSETNKTLGSVVDEVNQSENSIKHINNSVNEQYQGVRQINEAVTMLDRGTQSNAQLVDGLNTIAHGMQTIANDLNEYVSHFKIDE